MFFNPRFNPENLANEYKEFVYSPTCWTTPNGKFFNKFNAYNAANGDMNLIQFSVAPEWEHVDFSQSPKTEYFELVKQRARHIRQNYEYVRFWLSGGLDAYTALWGFIESGCQIDEIVIARKFLNSPTELNSFEENITVPKILDYYKKQLRTTKITYLDYNWTHFDQVLSTNDTDWVTWSFGSGGLELRLMVDWGNPFLRYPELLSLFDQGVKVADVRGLEKSTVTQINGEWFQVMLDTKLIPHSAGHPGIVSFYFDHEFPELFVADAHLRKNGGQTRLPHPFHNAISHQYHRKYHKIKARHACVKSIIMEVECSLDPDRAYLLDLYYNRMESIQKKYPGLVPDDWAVTGGPAGHFGLASSLERNYCCMYHDLPTPP